MPVTTITTVEQYNEIINGETPAVIDFWAQWCGPCRMISPVLEGLSNDETNTLTADKKVKLQFYKLSIDDLPTIAEELKISSIPLFIVFNKGEKVGELVGADREGLKALVEKAGNI